MKNIIFLVTLFTFLGSRDRLISAPMPVTYVVYTGSSEVWTPTNNPYTDVSGITAIAIDANNILIQPGASLTIADMTIRFSENSHVDVQNATSAGATGGRLLLNSTTLTKPTTICTGVGCMWGGVRIWGDPAYPQGILASSPQGAILMDNNSTISYAATGVYLCSPTIVYATSGGGGIIQANNSTFINNSTDVNFFSYQNITIAGELKNLSHFDKCTFNTTDASTVAGTLKHVIGSSVKGISFSGCTFSVPAGSSFPSYGIYGVDMGITVAAYYTYTPPLPIYPTAFSSFNNLTCGIYHRTAGIPANTAYVANATFNNDKTGIQLCNTLYASILSNTFNIPLAPASPGDFFTAIKAIGLNLVGASGYIVQSNTFQCLPYSVSPFSHNYTVGVLANNTEITHEDNLVNNNTYKGLGVGNLGNYRNRDGANPNHGVWFKCNVNVNNMFDIATSGTSTGALVNGIRNNQGYAYSSYYAGYAAGLPAGNVFSASSSPGIYNLYIDPGVSLPFTYYYSSTGAPAEQPGNHPYSAYSSVGKSVIMVADECGIDAGYDVSTTTTTTTATIGHLRMPIPVTAVSSPADIAQAINYNINYYMSDSGGVVRRDSLYYWVGQLPKAEADFTTAYLLLEDGFADSAYTLFHSIPVADSLDSISAAEFTTYGNPLFDVQSSLVSWQARKNSDMVLSLTDLLNADTVVLHDSLLQATNPYPLSVAAITSLTGIFTGSRQWPHFMAENILAANTPVLYASLIVNMPDTLVFPSGPGGQPTVKATTSVPTAPEVRTPQQITVYPNPATLTVNFTFPYSGETTIKMMDVTGRLMDEQVQYNITSTSFNVAAYTPGIYMYQVITNGMTQTGKILIAR